MNLPHRIGVVGFEELHKFGYYRASKVSPGNRISHKKKNPKVNPNQEREKRPIGEKRR